jgi:hypothetical protein
MFTHTLSHTHCGTQTCSHTHCHTHIVAHKHVHTGGRIHTHSIYTHRHACMHADAMEDSIRAVASSRLEMIIKNPQTRVRTVKQATHTLLSCCIHIYTSCSPCTVRPQLACVTNCALQSAQFSSAHPTPSLCTFVLPCKSIFSYTSIPTLLKKAPLTHSRPQCSKEQQHTYIMLHQNNTAP